MLNDRVLQDIGVTRCTANGVDLYGANSSRARARGAALPSLARKTSSAQ
jgi:hypothetical protein